MEYSKIVSVTGLPGLYELLSTKSDGAIVRSMDDKTTKFASTRIHNFSQLESIEVYTVGDNVNLVDVFKAMEKTGGALPDTKDNDVVRKYFEKVYPDIDFDRVYNSDLKKMIKWFETLSREKVELKLSEPAPETEEEAPSEEAPEKEQKPAKAAKEKSSEKPAAKKPVAEKEKVPAAKAKKTTKKK
jgi:Domain of unknown function (DUF5606)